MRLIVGVSAVFICTVSLVALSQGSNAVEALPNIWNSNIAVTEEGDMTQSEVTSGTHCDNTPGKARTLEGFAGINIAGLPQFLQADVEHIDIGTICATRNSSGLFGGRYYSPTQNPLDLLLLQPGPDNGVIYRAAPLNNVVIQSAKVGSSYTVGINYNFSAIGQLGVSQRAFLKYDFNWVVQNSAQQLRYIDGSNVLHNGLEFSGNGKYMVLRLGNTFTKVDLATQELTPFHNRASITGVVSMAISRDGRYVATHMNGETFIHDTLGCTTSYGKGQWPKITQTTFAGCTKSTNHYSKLTQALPGYGVVRKLEFSQNDSNLTLAFGQEYRTNSFYWKKLRMAALDYKSTEQGYLAMGDSFTSGEGDLQGGDWYEPGTDEQGNKDTFEKIDEFIVPESGEVDRYIQLPDDAESGMHEVHLFGTTNIGQEVDYYEQVMLAESESDFDGDGVPNNQDSCPTLINSFIDEDQDGVDDACDGEVSEFQAPEEEETVLFDDGREKGQPNPETVAGNEAVQDTLGANTGSGAQDSGQNVLSAVTGLQNTGKSAVIFVIIGVSTILSVLLVAKYWNQG